MNDEVVFKSVLDAAFVVHTILGPGLLENAYEKCLVAELRSRGLFVEEQKIFPLCYKGEKMDLAYRVDLLVENKVIVEIKAVESLNNFHWAQILNYLKLSGLKLGLLVNFNTASLKDGFRRVVNTSTSFNRTAK